MTYVAVDVGERVRVLRGNAGLSAERLAARAGTTTASVTRIENGETRDPGYILLTRLAMALNFPGVDAMLGAPAVQPEELDVPYWESTAPKRRRARQRGPKLLSRGDEAYRQLARDIEREPPTASEAGSTATDLVEPDEAPSAPDSHQCRRKRTP